MKRYSVLIGLAISVGLLSGCSGAKPEAAAKPQAAIVLEQSDFTVESWKMDNSHVVPVHGKVLTDGQPVSGVEVRLAGKRGVVTKDDGVFEFMLDRSLPQTLGLDIQSAGEAKVAGKPLGESGKKALLAAKEALDIYYPIQVAEVKTSANNPDMVEVHARAVAENGQDFPVAVVYKYAIKGTVKTADGSPVKGAVVSYTRENGEGWSRSEPTDDKGQYILYYSPEADQDLVLNVHVGQTKYTLPENRVYRFPEDTSVQTDIILPAEGNVIDDKPPTLVSRRAEGAVYWSLMVGVSVDSGVRYTVTLPAKDGSFVVTLPKKVWDSSPTFFETRMTRFSTDPIAPGDTISAESIPAPQPGDPQAIPVKQVNG